MSKDKKKAPSATHKKKTSDYQKDKGTETKVEPLSVKKK
jgi:hypothetical protein